MTITNKPSIVTAKGPKRVRPRKGQPAAFDGPRIVATKNLGPRQHLEPEIDPEAEAQVKAFFARMMRPPGRLG